jgi:deoxyribonuclease-4
MKSVPLLGSHVSISGGVHTAFERGSRIGCTTMQVFTKNANQWKSSPLTDQDIQNYKTAQANANIGPVVAHAAYLINLCAKNPSTLRMSRSAFVDELQRCEALGISALIVHPGSHVGLGEEEGIQRIAESLNITHEKTPGFHVRSTLETTAGQGTAIGYRFEQLQAIISLVQQKERMAVCLDTCHVFAAGYDIRTEEGWNETLVKFDSIIGLRQLAAIHVNDSKKGLGLRVDRHEHIGRGLIGTKGFSLLMNDPRLVHVPKILETEKSEDMHEDIENMAILRSLIHEAGNGTPAARSSF